MAERFNTTDLVKLVDITENPFIPRLRVWEKTVRKSVSSRKSTANELDADALPPDEVEETVYEGSDYIKLSAVKLNKAVGDLSKTEYRLLRVIEVLVEGSYNFNGAIELYLELLNNPLYLVGAEWTKKTMYAAIKTLCTEVDSGIGPVLIKHAKLPKVYWVNPNLMYRGFKKILLKRYHAQKGEKEYAELRLCKS